MRSVTNRRSPRAGRRASRQGGVLLEFAVVALVFYLLFAAVADMGRATFMASTAGDAARLMARELARVPLPPDYNFDQALQSDEVRWVAGSDNPGIYDARFLVVDLDNDLAAGETLDAFFADKPLVNRALRPLMIFDSPTIDGVKKRLYRYPGTLLKKTNTSGGNDQYLVAIPVVETPYPGSGGGDSTANIVSWLPVVQEVREIPPGFFVPKNESPFELGSPDRGVAAVRINVPFQSSTTYAVAVDPNAPLAEQETLSIVYADQGVGSPPPAGIVVGGAAEVMQASAFGDESGAYAGQYGLGRFYALGREVRPFRRILSGQAIYRREVFDFGSTSSP